MNELLIESLRRLVEDEQEEDSKNKESTEVTDSEDGKEENNDTPEESSKGVEVKDAKDLVQKVTNLPYEQAVTELKKIAEDTERGYELLKKAFADPDNKVTISVSDGTALAKSLVPTQSEIGLGNSLKYSLEHPDSIPALFKNPVTIKVPILVLNNKYIMDGHHRWSTIYMFNPNAQVKIKNLTIEGISKVTDALKTLQAELALETHGKALKNDKTGSLVGENLFSLNDKGIIKAVKGYMTEGAIKVLKKIYGLDTNKDVIKRIASNAYSLTKKYSSDAKNKPDRIYMPQTSEHTVDNLDKHDAIKVFESLNKTNNVRYIDMNKSNILNEAFSLLNEQDNVDVNQGFRKKKLTEASLGQKIKNKVSGNTSEVLKYAIFIYNRYRVIKALANAEADSEINTDMPKYLAVKNQHGVTNIESNRGRNPQDIKIKKLADKAETKIQDILEASHCEFIYQQRNVDELKKEVKNNIDKLNSKVMNDVFTKVNQVYSDVISQASSMSPSPSKEFIILIRKKVNDAKMNEEGLT